MNHPILSIRTWGNFVTFGLLFCCFTASTAFAELTFNVGTHLFYPSRISAPDPTVRLQISGDELIEGITLNVQVADGFSEVDDTGIVSGATINGPNITDVLLAEDALGVITEPDLIFNESGTRPGNDGQTNKETLNQLWIVETAVPFTTPKSEVLSSGLLAIVTFDLEGRNTGSWDLKVADTANLDTIFAKFPEIPLNQITLTNGTIEIVEHSPFLNQNQGADPLDVNNDGFVSALDALLAVVDDNNRADGLIPLDATADAFFDVNDDFQVNGDDLTAIINRLKNSGSSNEVLLGSSAETFFSGSSLEVNAVPEPSTWGLGLIAIAMLVAIVIFRKRSACC